MNPSSLVSAIVLSLVFFAQIQPSNADLQGCSGKLSPNARQRCEEIFAQQIRAASRTSPLPGGWQLVRTPDPRGGTEAVSVLHAADTAKSDANLAGLTFRCGPAGIEMLLILLEPLIRESQYAVRVKSGSAETQFEARAVQGGEVLLLPPGATALAGGSWQAAPELSIDIGGPVPIHGSVAVSGLSGALQALSQNCPSH